jgi:hypothetical protein
MAMRFLDRRFENFQHADNLLRIGRISVGDSEARTPQLGMNQLERLS